MKIENTEVFGFKAALRGMRNPMNSWNKSDSEIFDDSFMYPNGIFKVGPKDNELAMSLIKAGTEHCKFLRLIHIQVDFTLPRYIWQELDTYKVATTRMSCSTMHKLGSQDLTYEDFQDGVVYEGVLGHINYLGDMYRKNKDLDTLRQMKQLLPEGFLQKATYDMNYQTAMLMYYQRKAHRMSEWSGENGICKWIESLPMMNEWLNIK